MGFIQLKQKMRKAVKPVFYLIIVIFVVGAFYSFGSAPNSNQGPDGGPAPDRDVSKIVAVVNGDKIPRTSLDGYLYEVERRSGGPIPVEQHRYVLQNWLESNINEIANVQAVAEADIDISSDEIEQKRIDIIDAQLEPQIESRTALAARLEREGLTLDEYRENLLRELRNSDRGSNAAIRTLLGYEKLQEAIEATVTVSDEDLKASFAELTAREITVSADTLRWDAQQPIDDEIAELEKEIEAAAELDEEAAADRQQKLDELTVDRDALENRDFESEARETIDGLLEQLQGGADFAELAEKHSTSSTSENGGEMTTAQTRRNMPAEVWTAASALEPGQITGVVESYYGLQIIKVEGREPALPDDFEDAKETHRTTLTTELQNAKWREYQTDLRKSAQVEIIDLELQAYELMDNDGAEMDIIGLLDQATQSDSGNIGAKFELAELWRGKGQSETAMTLLAQIAEVPGADRSAQLMKTLGELYADAGRKQEAVEAYKKASDNAAEVTYGNDGIHTDLMAAFALLGEMELANQEAEWLERYRAWQQEQMGAGAFGDMGNITIP